MKTLVPDGAIEQLKSFFSCEDRLPSDAELSDLAHMTLWVLVCRTIEAGPEEAKSQPYAWQTAMLALGRLGKSRLAEELELGLGPRGEA